MGDSVKPKTKEQIAGEERAAAEKKRIEEEKTAFADARKLAGLCPCIEVCYTKGQHRKDALKKLRTKTKDTGASSPCLCESVCVDGTLVETNFTRDISKPPYTTWNGTLTCPPDSLYASRLTKTTTLIHNKRELVRGTWTSPEPEFWLNNVPACR